ncbi:hypothetical protein [Amnibacterium kyonggiense]
MHHPLRTVRRRAVLVASGTAVLLAVGGGATAAVAATADGTPAPSKTPAACGVHLRAELRGAMPGQLKADLKKLRAEPKGAARAAERKAIREKALAGGYGARAGEVARVVGGGKAAKQALATELPASLRADLKTLRGEPKGTARRAEAEQIEQKALAGDYGTTIQTNVKTVQARFQAKCEAKQG